MGHESQQHSQGVVGLVTGSQDLLKGRRSQSKRLVEMEMQGFMTALSGSSGSAFEIQGDYVTKDGNVSGQVRLYTVVSGTVIGNPAHNEGIGSINATLQGTPSATTQPESLEQTEQLDEGGRQAIPSQQLGHPGRLVNYASHEL